MPLNYKMPETLEKLVQLDKDLHQRNGHTVDHYIGFVLALFITLKELYVIERFKLYKSKSDFIKDYNENYLKDIDLRESELKFFIEELRDNVVEGITEINDAYAYITDLRKHISIDIKNSDDS